MVITYLLLDSKCFANDQLHQVFSESLQSFTDGYSEIFMFWSHWMQGCQNHFVPTLKEEVASIIQSELLIIVTESIYLVYVAVLQLCKYYYGCEQVRLTASITHTPADICFTWQIHVFWIGFNLTRSTEARAKAWKQLCTQMAFGQSRRGTSICALIESFEKSIQRNAVLVFCCRLKE